MKTVVKTQKEILIAKLNSAIASADAPEGVTYSVEDCSDLVLLTAAYSDGRGYFDEPFDALGEVVDGMDGLIVEAGNGLVHHCITYQVAE